MSDINGMYGRTEADGTISVWSASTGAAVTFMPADVKPVGSELSARKNHPLGIKLTRKDALAIGLEIRGAAPSPTPVPLKPENRPKPENKPVEKVPDRSFDRQFPQTPGPQRQPQQPPTKPTRHSGRFDEEA